MTYIKGFDTLRALGVIFVIIAHWGPFFTPGSMADAIMDTSVPGIFWVVLFFLLSGFLISTILFKARYKAMEDGSSRGTILKSYYIRMVLRIFPIYYLTLFVLLLIGDPYLKANAGWYFGYLANILPHRTNQINPLIHMWTLAVEEQFYIIWPCLILFLKEKYLMPTFILAIVVGVVSKYVVMYVYHHNFAVLMLNWTDAFGLGTLYAYLRVNNKHKAFEKAFVGVVIVTLLVAVGKAPVAGLPIFMVFDRELNAVLALGLVIFVLNNKSEWLRKYVLENRFMNALGQMSYGLYLYHFVIDGYVDDLMTWSLSHFPHAPAFLHNFWSYYAAKVIAVLIVARLSYKYLELPLLGLKKYFDYNKEKKPSQEHNSYQEKKVLQAEKAM